MASHPLTAEAMTPAASGAVRPSVLSTWGNLSSAAAAMIGMLMRKLKTAASSRVKRSDRPAVIVDP